MGLPHVTTAQMEDFAGLMRRLWAGEVVLGHDGPAGSWPYLNLDGIEGLDIPLGLVAFGPNSLQLGGRAFDQVVLHTFFTDETTARVVQDGEGRGGAGRSRSRRGEGLVVLRDRRRPHRPRPRAKKTVGRLATYLTRATATCWCAPTTGIRRCSSASGPTSSSPASSGAIDRAATTEELEHVATLIPDEWMEPMAKGTPEQCVAAVRNQFDLGCDGVIMHGATPDELEPVIKAYAASN